MSEDKQRYKVGDKFPATIRITRASEEEDEYWLEVLDFKLLDIEAKVGDWYESEELDEAFDPTYKKRMMLKRKKELSKELEELNNKLSEDD